LSKDLVKFGDITTTERKHQSLVLKDTDRYRQAVFDYIRGKVSWALKKAQGNPQHVLAWDIASIWSNAELAKASESGDLHS
jgi:hypothetical protein